MCYTVKIKTLNIMKTIVQVCILLSLCIAGKSSPCNCSTVVHTLLQYSLVHGDSIKTMNYTIRTKSIGDENFVLVSDFHNDYILMKEESTCKNRSIDPKSTLLIDAVFIALQEVRMTYPDTETYGTTPIKQCVATYKTVPNVFRTSK